jgi:SAM-dependent methyltransferase
LVSNRKIAGSKAVEERDGEKSLIGKYFYRWRNLRTLMAPFLGPHGAVVQYLTRIYSRHCEKVLDLGARRSPYTYGLPGVVVGLDLPSAQEEKLGFNQQALISYDQERRFPVFGRGEQLPFKNDTFDAILLIEVIEHIALDRIAIMEINRALRPGGVLVLTTPNGTTFPRPTKHHVRHYTPEALRTLIDEHFSIERFWCLFPKGKLWDESVASVRKMIEARDIGGLLRHFTALALYWPKTLVWFLANKQEGTTTLCLVARKP